MNNKNKEVLLSGEVGLLFPVYAMGIPKIVEEFLKRIQIKKVRLFRILSYDHTHQLKNSTKSNTLALFMVKYFY